MSDEVENLLRSMRPQGAPPDLRARVMAAVDDELTGESSRPQSRRGFPFGLATAAAVLLSVVVDQLAARTNEDRLARAFGPRPVSPMAVELARDVAEVAGPEAGRWTFERLSTPPPPPTEAERVRQAVEVGRLIRELTHESVENDHEDATQEIPQVDRDRDRRRAGRVLLVERILHDDHGPSA